MAEDLEYSGRGSTNPDDKPRRDLTTEPPEAATAPSVPQALTTRQPNPAAESTKEKRLTLALALWGALLSTVLGGYTISGFHHQRSMEASDRERIQLTNVVPSMHGDSVMVTAINIGQRATNLESLQGTLYTGGEPIELRFSGTPLRMAGMDSKVFAVGIPPRKPMSVTLTPSPNGHGSMQLNATDGEETRTMILPAHSSMPVFTSSAWLDLEVRTPQGRDSMRTQLMLPVPLQNSAVFPAGSPH